MMSLQGSAGPSGIQGPPGRQGREVENIHCGSLYHYAFTVEFREESLSCEI